MEHQTEKAQPSTQQHQTASQTQQPKEESTNLNQLLGQNHQPLVVKRFSAGPGSVAPVRVSALAVGATALGAFALGALALGALAIGRLMVGQMAMRRAKVGSLEIEELNVQRVRVAELEVTGRLKIPDPNAVASRLR